MLLWAKLLSSLATPHARQEEGIVQVVESMRGRFKTLLSMLGLADGYGLAGNADSLEF